MAVITRLFDINEKVLKLRENSTDELLSTGFKTLDLLYMVKPTNTTIIYGYPKMGKTEFLFQLLISLSLNYGKKHLIYSPESGSAEEIYAAIIHGLTGKTFDKRYTSNYITEAEYYRVQPFVQEHFIVAEDTDEQGLNFDEYIKLVKQCKKDFGIHTSTIDNWNDIEHENYTNVSDYLKRKLPKWNKLALSQKIHSFLICHAKNPIGLKNGELPKAPTPYEIDGGAAWLQKAYNMICINREYVELNGGVQLGNEVDVIIQKVKPRIVGKTGTCKLDYDWLRKCYSETYDGQIHQIESPFKEKYKAPEKPKEKPIQSSINLNQQFEDAPF
jgi:KaiC/GvpD/RAD55 family RecA-like ATPase